MPLRDLEFSEEQHGASVIAYISARPEAADHSSVQRPIVAVLIALCACGWGLLPAKSAVLGWAIGGLGLALVVVVWRICAGQRVVEEAVVCMKDLGLEIRTRFASGRIASEFVDLALIQDVVIAEAVTFFDVYYYLAVRMHPDKQSGLAAKLKLPFEQLIPKLPNLVRVLHGLQENLRETAVLPTPPSQPQDAFDDSRLAAVNAEVTITAAEVEMGSDDAANEG